MKLSRDHKEILIITPFFSPNIGGVETHLDDLCQYLQKERRNVQVVTYQPITTRAKGQKVEKRGTVRIRRISWFGHNWFLKLEPYPPLEFLYLFPGLFLYGFFYLLRRRKRVQVIHAHGLIAGAVGTLLARLFRKHSVLSTHTTYALPQRLSITKIARSILNSYGRILCLSKKSKKELESTGVHPDKVKVYTYWVDQEIFKPLGKEKYKKQFGWEGKFVALFVGRLIPVKGVDLLLDTAQALADKNIYFAFAGDGPLTEKVEEAAKNWGNVIFLGPLKSQDLVPYYNAADILVVPSISEEGFGRVIIEALSCGTPVIASNRGGIPEAVDKSVGILIEPKVDTIASAIENLYTDNGKLAGLSMRCRSYAVRRFGEQNAVVIEVSYTKELKDSNVAIVTHYFFATGAPTELEQYLIPRVKNLFFIAHPFSFAKEVNSFYRRYQNSRLVKRGKAFGWRLPEVLIYCKDVFYTLLWIFLSGLRFDIFIGADNLNAFSGLILRKLGRAKTVVFYTIDYVPQRFRNRLLNFIYHWVDKVCVMRVDQTWNLSPRMAEARASKGVDPSLARQVFVPVGARYHRMQRLPIEAINRYEIAFIGHLTEKQGVEVVIDAMPLILREIPEARFLIVGTGPQENELKKRVEQLGLEKHVEFTGLIDDHILLEERLKKCAISVAPYNSKLDTFTYFADPEKIKNYLAASLPVVLTDVPYIAKELEERGCGIIVDCVKEDISRAVIKLLSDERVLKVYREAAARFGAEFEWDKIFDRAFAKLFLN